MEPPTRWLSKVGVGLYTATSGRRDTLGWLGRAAAGLTSVSIALTGVRSTNAAGTTASTPLPSGRPATPVPVLLPRGQKAILPVGCNTCSGTAEYVCTDCCVGSTCCPGRDLYRQPCYDAACNLYYTYWCA